MDPDEAVDWTIRNQRVRGPVEWAWLLGWAAVWMAGAYIAERLTPWEWRLAGTIVFLAVIIASFVIVIVYLDRHRRVFRVKLGDELRVVPGRRLEPGEIAALRLSPDPDEDYVESITPIPLRLLTVEPRRGSRFHMVITAGDAGRLRAWADRKRVAVSDSEGCSTGQLRTDPK
jgi:hypothetical protein